MPKLTTLGAVLLVGSLGVALAAPSADVGTSVPALVTISSAEAAIGRGGEGGEGGQGSGSQVGPRAASWLQGFIVPLFFIGVAGALIAAILQRNAGTAFAILVGAVVIGAFLLAPDKVESLYRSIYNYVL